MSRAAKIIIFFIVFAILAVIFIILYVPNIYFCHKSKELRFLSITPEPYPFSESAVPEDYKRTDLNGVSFMAPAKLDEGGKDNWKSLRSESGDFEVRVCSPNNFKENAYDFDIRLVKGEVPDNLYKRTTAAVNLTYDDVKPLIPYNAFFFYHLAVKKEKTASSYLGGGYTNLYQFSNDFYDGYVFYGEISDEASSVPNNNAVAYLYSKESNHKTEQVVYIGTPDEKTLAGVLESLETE